MEMGREKSFQINPQKTTDCEAKKGVKLRKAVIYQLACGR